MASEHTWRSDGNVSFPWMSASGSRPAQPDFSSQQNLFSLTSLFNGVNKRQAIPSIRQGPHTQTHRFGDRTDEKRGTFERATSRSTTRHGAAVSTDPRQYHLEDKSCAFRPPKRHH